MISRTLFFAGLVFVSLSWISCGKRPPEDPETSSETAEAPEPEGGIYGTWKGSVLIVDVEFKFRRDSYIQRTFSFNNIQIGGTKGSMKVEDALLRIHQTHEFQYDNDTRTGKWVPKPADYTIAYEIKGKSVTLHPSTSKETMELSRD